MTEQVVEGVHSVEVDPESRTGVPRGRLGEQTAAVPSEPVNVIWQASGQGRLIGERSKTLAERVRDAYKHGLAPEEKDLLDGAAGQFGRRLSREE